MPKKSRSFSLDEDVTRRLERQVGVNTSAIVNKMLRQYLDSGQAPEVALITRLERLNQEIDNLDAEIEGKKQLREQLVEGREEVQRQMHSHSEQQEEEVQEVAQMVENGAIPSDRLAPDATVIQHRAGKADMSPQRFVQEVESEL